MVRLRVSSESDVLALEYARRLTKSGIRKKVLSNLNSLVDTFQAARSVKYYIDKTWISENKATIVKYLKHIISRYDSLRAIHPHKMQREIRIFESILEENYVNQPLYIDGDGSKRPSLANQIVKAMMYNEVRETVFPEFVRRLGIKSCVYCNANYVIADKDNRGYFDLDHFYPKSIYPYLCTSFYNLQPSCASCNRRKSAKSHKKFFNLWEDNGRRDLEVMKFKFEPGVLADYMATHDLQSLRFDYEECHSRDEPMKEDTEESLHLKPRYMEHLDVLEEIIWRCQAFNGSYLDALKNGLPELGILAKDVARFILGNYTSLSDVHKRPLSKITIDTAKELGVIDEEGNVR